MTKCVKEIGENSGCVSEKETFAPPFHIIVHEKFLFFYFTSVPADPYTNSYELQSCCIFGNFTFV